MNTSRTFKSLCLALLAMMVLGQFTAFAQDDDAKRGGFGQGRGRLFGLTERLVRQTRALSDQMYLDYDQGRNDGRDSRYDIETLYRAQGLSSQAELFQKMVRDRRAERDLRRALTLMTSQAGTGYQWNDIRQTLDEISRNLRNNDYGNGGNPGGYNPGNGGYNGNSGQLRWTGRVDAEVNIYIQNGTARTQTISGAPTYGEQFSFTTSLPRVPVTVSVNKLRGRGQVDVIQQPSRQNGFTAIVRIVDRDGGAGDYDFQLNW